MGHDEHESQLNKERALHCHRTTTNWSLHCTATPERQSRQDENAIITACAVVADDVSHRVARC
jgi:hypothetical protein